MPQAIAAAGPRLLHSSMPTDAERAASLFTPYVVALCTLIVACALLLFLKERKNKCSITCGPTAGYDLRFLLPYGVCAAADWLQGPYVYALYDSYGYDHFTINALFVVGFTAAMVTGPIVGAVADRFGLRLMVVVGYCVTYALACVTKHFSSLTWLYLGRLLGGTATSVLFSCFESWLVAEYTAGGQSGATIGAALSRMYFINGMAGILMGPLAQVFVSAAPLTPLNPAVNMSDPSAISTSNSVFVGGDATAFDLSFLFLSVGMCLVLVLWGEHRPYYTAAVAGEATSLSNAAAAEGFACLPAIKWLCTQPVGLLLMLGSACTEAAMYSFVIEWTPALTTANTTPPHGLVFAAFLTAYMIGATLLPWLSSSDVQSDAALLAAIAGGVASVAMAVAAFFEGQYMEGDAAPLHATFAVFCAMCVFEGCLGAYFALVGSVKASQVPENMRATVYGTFRVPLNLLVVLIELFVTSSAMAFAVCTVLLLTGLVCFLFAYFGIRSQAQKGEAASEKTPLT